MSSLLGKGVIIMRSSEESYRTGEFALTDEEVEKLLGVSEDFKEHVFLKFAISTGLRRSDVVAIKWKDVDLVNRRITFYEKKKDRIKDVYISEGMAQDLRRLQSVQAGEYYVFTGRSEPKYGKGHLSSRSAYDVLQRNLKKAGIEKRPFHSLRATCIKMCQRRGWSEAQTAKHVGDTVRVIQEHYSTPSAGEMQEAAVNRCLL